MRSTRTIDRVFTIANQLLLQKPVKTDVELPGLEELTLSDVQDMTLAEKHNSNIQTVLLKAVLLLADSKSVPGQEVDKLLKQAEEWLVQTLPSISSESTLEDITISIPSRKLRVPSWLFFHSNYSIVETVKALSLLLSVAKSKKSPKAGARPSKELIERLVELVNQVHEAIKTNAKSLRSNVMGSGILGSMTDLIFHKDSQDEDGELQKELEDSLDSSAVEIFCGELMESWEEAVGGIMFLK